MAVRASSFVGKIHGGSKAEGSLFSALNSRLLP